MDLLELVPELQEEIIIVFLDPPTRFALALSCRALRSRVESATRRHGITEPNPIKVLDEWVKEGFLGLVMYAYERGARLDYWHVYFALERGHLDLARAVYEIIKTDLTPGEVLGIVKQAASHDRGEFFDLIATEQWVRETQMAVLLGVAEAFVAAGRFKAALAFLDRIDAVLPNLSRMKMVFLAAKHGDYKAACQFCGSDGMQGARLVAALEGAFAGCQLALVESIIPKEDRLKSIFIEPAINLEFMRRLAGRLPDVYNRMKFSLATAMMMDPTPELVDFYLSNGVTLDFLFSCIFKVFTSNWHGRDPLDNFPVYRHGKHFATVQYIIQKNNGQIPNLLGSMSLPERQKVPEFANEEVMQWELENHFLVPNNRLNLTSVIHEVYKMDLGILKALFEFGWIPSALILCELAFMENSLEAIAEVLSREIPRTILLEKSRKSLFRTLADLLLDVYSTSAKFPLEVNVPSKRRIRFHNLILVFEQLISVGFELTSEVAFRFKEMRNQYFNCEIERLTKL